MMKSKLQDWEIDDSDTEDIVAIEVKPDDALEGWEPTTLIVQREGDTTAKIRKRNAINPSKGTHKRCLYAYKNGVYVFVQGNTILVTTENLKL